ncbi:MAG: glycoside hydrolase family 5 protein [Chloroflexi bacterium]|nr:glycoside hydrolase family 5 protein [Chloroflexota bacterium]
MGRIKATKLGFQLDGKPFVPWGSAYFIPYTGWAPQLWSTFTPQRVESDMACLSELGANVVRVFTTWKWFLAPKNAVNEEGMRRLDQMLAIAWRHGLRLLITGPDHWEGAPTFLEDHTNIFYDDPMRRARTAFWRELGRRYKDDERIFAYYVANEPWVGPHASLWAEWQPAAQAHGWPESFDELPPANWDNPEGRLALELLRQQTANRWLSTEVDAIRSSGTHTLISCGFFPMVFPYYAFMSCGLHLQEPSEMLDFLSVHLYPHKPNTPEAFRKEIDRMALIAGYAASFGKPLLIGEYGCVGGNTESYSAPWGSEYPPTSEELQALWCHDFALSSSVYASGWLCWGMYDIPEATDSTRYSGLFTADGRAKAWAEQFKGMASQVTHLRARDDLPRYKFDRFGLYSGIVDPFSGLESWLKRRRFEGDFILEDGA